MGENKTFSKNNYLINYLINYFLTIKKFLILWVIYKGRQNKLVLMNAPAPLPRRRGRPQIPTNIDRLPRLGIMNRGARRPSVELQRAIWRLVKRDYRLRVRLNGGPLRRRDLPPAPRH